MDKGAENYALYLSGNDEGFYGIVREYYDGLTMYINGIVGDFFRAEELADDTLFKLAAQRPSFGKRSSFKTWLYSIGRNVALDSLRREPVRELEQLADAADVSEGPEETYIADERKKQLYRALDKLDPGYREVLWLLFFEDMTPDTISAVTGKKRNYVYRNIFQDHLCNQTVLELSINHIFFLGTFHLLF